MTFLNSILNNSKEHKDPFKHWELNEPLSNEAIQEIIKADIPNVTDHNLNYDGTRAIDGGAPEFREGIASGGKAIKFRCFITKDNVKKFPEMLKLIRELQSKQTYEKISSLINKDLKNSYVRVEIICDREGFWLKPHCDIKEKIISCLLFVNQFNESENLGTDLYNVKLEKDGDILVGDKGIFNVLTGKGEISTEPNKEGGRKKVYGIIRSKKK